jgi:hypothetical protein
MDMLTLTGSVGLNGKNINKKDIMRVQALINVYRRTKGDCALAVNGRNSKDLESAINSFQTNYMQLKNASSRVDTSDAVLNALVKMLATVFTPQAVTAPAFGVVTWEAEGAEGGIFHSRKLHVPTTSSGLTIGRGYDFQQKTLTKIIADLTAAGLNSKNVTTLKNAAGLSGTAAKNFITENDLLDFQITIEQQKLLFKKSYDDESEEVKRICAKDDVVKLYGETKWDALNVAIKDITIDLKFRGDYTTPVRKIIQKSIVGNDLKEFKKLLKNKTNWPNVPQDRFARRAAFLDNVK